MALSHANTEAEVAVLTNGLLESRPNISVAICTFHRNEPLRHLLQTLAGIAEREKERMAIGVVVVDDSKDQLAKLVVEAAADQFENGAAYRHSGKRNISKARNLALETSLETGAEWIAMTDDDCEPAAQWLGELLRVQKEHAADVVTGPLLRRAPESAPRWLREQPFLGVTAFQAETGRKMDLAFTNNSMISAKLLRNNPELRFDPDFGRIGGEDMVFFRSVAKRGFQIVFAREAQVFENEEKERLTLRYQLRRHFWIGNSSVRTTLENGSSKPRMAIHAVATLARALRRPLVRMASGHKPQLLYCAAQVCEAAGKLAGVSGIQVKHK